MKRSRNESINGFSDVRLVVHHQLRNLKIINIYFLLQFFLWKSVVFTGDEVAFVMAINFDKIWGNWTVVFPFISFLFLFLMFCEHEEKFLSCFCFCLDPTKKNKNMRNMGKKFFPFMVFNGNWFRWPPARCSLENIFFGHDMWYILGCSYLQSINGFGMQPVVEFCGSFQS